MNRRGSSEKGSQNAARMFSPLTACLNSEAILDQWVCNLTEAASLSNKDSESECS